jgi:hypothetical protein
MGMAITSGKNYIREADLFESVSNYEDLITVTDIDQVRRTIAYYHVQQDSNPSVSSYLADENLSIEEKVNKLVSLIEAKTGAVISFKLSSHDWHAVTPIAVEFHTNNQYRIWVYDSNYSNMIRPMYVNLDENFLMYKWHDDIAKTPENEEKSKKITVSADFRVTPLDLFSKRVEYRPQDKSILQIFGLTYLQIVNDVGDLIGFFSGDHLNQIENAEIIPVVNSFDSWDEPVYWLPNNSGYEVTIVPADF